MKNLIAGILFFALSSICFAQIRHNGIGEPIKLEPVVVVPANVTYLNMVRDRFTPKQLWKLQEKVARFNIKDTKEYENGIEPYLVIFKESNGNIKTIYDQDGNILSSVERFKDVALPISIIHMVMEKHPGWSIDGDKYVNYYRDDKIVKRNYSLRLSKDDVKKNVTIDLVAQAENRMYVVVPSFE